MFFDEITLTEQSRKRLGFFMKIEELQCAIMLSLCQYLKPKLFVDVGANVGLYSLLLKKYFPQIGVICIEPSPVTFKELRANFDINKDLFNFVTLHNFAVSSSIGQLRFLNFGDCSGMNAIEETSIHNPVEALETIDVYTYRLDDLLIPETICGNDPHTENKIVIKIDTEGHELEVIYSGASYLMANQCLLQIEDGHKKSENNISDVMVGYGYKKIFTAGPDSYYTNIVSLHDPVLFKDLVQNAINFLIAHRWGGNPPLG